MAHVVTEPCVDCKYTDCVEVCPVACFHETDHRVVIDPDVCIDCSACGVLSFRIRGGKGGEKPNVYLDDGNHRWGVDIEKYAAVTTTWQTVTIPLADLAEYGVDLTHLEQIQFAFEWEQMSGAIELDDIRLGAPEGGAPSVSGAVVRGPKDSGLPNVRLLESGQQKRRNQ